MKKMFRFAVIALTMSFVSGCASTGGMDGAMNSVGEFANSTVNVVKDIGGNLVPEGMENGTRVTPETLAMIKKGDSMAEVESLIGHSGDIALGSSGEVWSYQYTKIPHFGQNINEKTIVRFDKRGNVTRAYKANGGATNTGNPLLDAASAQGQF